MQVPGEQQQDRARGTGKSLCECAAHLKRGDRAVVKVALTHNSLLSIPSPDPVITHTFRTVNIQPFGINFKKIKWKQCQGKWRIKNANAVVLGKEVA